MVSLPTWFRYIYQKADYSFTICYQQTMLQELNYYFRVFWIASVCLSLGIVSCESNRLSNCSSCIKLVKLNYKRGRITDRELLDAIWKNILQGKLTYIEKAQKLPAFGGKSQTSLVRKIPLANPWHVAVGDVVVYKDPGSEDKRMIGRLIGTGGYEMVSTNEKDEPFVLNKDECWIVAGENNAKDTKDSRTYGPISTSNIVGRVIYLLENAVDHGEVQNSDVSTKKDIPVLEVELDVDEMVKVHQSSASK